MNKPEPKTRIAYDYHECAAYIAHKLGVPSLEDFEGKYTKTEWGDHTIKDVARFLDFTHFLLDHLNYSNGSEIHMPYYAYDEAQDWQKQILHAFKEEFGENAVYWMEW